MIGVLGRSGHKGQAAVYGEHHTSAGPGVVGDANGPDYAGVLGRNSDGTGVWANPRKPAIRVCTASTRAPWASVSWETGGAIRMPACWGTTSAVTEGSSRVAGHS